MKGDQGGDQDGKAVRKPQTQEIPNGKGEGRQTNYPKFQREVEGFHFYSLILLVARIERRACPAAGHFSLLALLF